MFPARDRGGNQFGYADDLLGAHWIAVLAVLCLLGARAAPGRPAQASFRIRITQFHMKTSRTSGMRAMNVSRGQ